MLALLIGFFLTFRIVLAEQRIQGAIGQVRALPNTPAGLGDGFIVANVRRFHAADYLPWLAPIWIAGVLFFHVRGMASWIAARRLRRRGVCAAPNPIRCCSIALPRDCGFPDRSCCSNPAWRTCRW